VRERNPWALFTCADPFYLVAGKDPARLPDAEYPDFLFNIKYEPMGSLRLMDPEEMTLEQARRFLKLTNRATIKTNNEMKSKKA
jgi:large subunit ribosomal protein L54